MPGESQPEHSGPEHSGGAGFFTRSPEGWIVSGVKNPNRAAVENYVRSVLTAEGEDFSEAKAEDPVFNDGKLILEMGNNKIYVIQFGPPGESGRRLASVENLPYVYVMAEWTIKRLFRNLDFFESTEEREE